MIKDPTLPRSRDVVCPRVRLFASGTTVRIAYLTFICPSAFSVSTTRLSTPKLWLDPMKVRSRFESLKSRIGFPQFICAKLSTKYIPCICIFKPAVSICCRKRVQKVCIYLLFSSISYS
jgi:hypothetical protein